MEALFADSKQASAGIGLIAFGCLLNSLVFEAIIKRAPGSGTTIAFFQFLFVVLGDCSVVFRKRRMPIQTYLAVTILFFLMNFTGNLALNYKVSMPLHIILKSSVLAVSMIIGKCFLGKRYTSRQVYGVTLVSLGIILVTLAESQSQLYGHRTSIASCCEQIEVISRKEDGCAESARGGNHCAGLDETEIPEVLLECRNPLDTVQISEKNDEISSTLFYGLTLMMASVSFSALLGHFQEQAFRTYGRHTDELKFFSHLMALPFFILFQGEGIIEQATTFHSSPTMVSETVRNFPTMVPLAKSLPQSISEIPSLWVLLAANVFLQYCCITGVFLLSSISSSLTCNLVVTIRKFISLIVSVWYFDNAFSEYHWLGTSFVFGGVFLYSGYISLPKSLVPVYNERKCK